ncbi:MAG: uroporphyrinogen-III C-methyltransferase [Nitrospinae bacterium RIFCSPLOWO2_12_39_16]|nr:MAG: uroporphyrinogen-III C-methyltransferase [Nitrospinae bacterium RIFCSPLOWO2_02_39_17]OGW09887.1 MAG: uroporphyrinogen-III C-methyltransferase [Nitrospinae bacterium RIFCSPLOWO2_12_39_16]
MKSKKVYLIGAGPGDPGLLTLKGKRCIEEANVIIYDHLVNKKLLEFAKDGAEIIYVGKVGGKHTKSQEEINLLLVTKAKEGKIVARLKGGDPFIFGRGGEEALELVSHKIPFEVIPGITAATSVPAYAGIPLTHRDFNSSIALITGHEDPSKGGSKIEWKGLSTCIENLIFFMGAKNLTNIVKKLIENGRKPDTPIAVIRWGTTPLQETIVGRLNDITEKAKNVRPPAIIVVGGVVALREKLNWFEKKPLFGKRILITRPRGQTKSFVELLENEGAIIMQMPTIETVPPDSWDALDNAINRLDTYQWLIFTSANGVRFFIERLKANKKDIRELKGIKICAIGPKTAASVESFGIRVDAVPEKYIAEGVIEEMKKHGIEGKKILLPRASVARDILPLELKKMGAEIDVVDAYKTVKSVEKASDIKNMIRKEKIDVITFTSSSTVKNFMSYFNLPPPLLRKEGIKGRSNFDRGDDRKMLKNITIASIGPITAKTVEEFGLKNNIVSDEHTIERFTEKIIEYFGRKENG